MGKTKLRPGITVDFRAGCVRVGKDVIRALNEPEYISIMKNNEKKTLLIIPCGEHEQLSFSVPNNLLKDCNKVFRIYSLQFTNEFRSEGGFYSDNYVRLQGYYDEKMACVVFPFGEEKDSFSIISKEMK